MGWNLSEESGFRTWRLSRRKTLWICFLPPIEGHQTKASSHSSALHWIHLPGGFCLPPGAKKPLWQLWCSVRDLERGFPSHQGALGVGYVVFMAVRSWWSCIKIWQRREGLRPMDCSSLPSSKGNFHPIKWINQIWVVSVDVHTERSSPRTACLAVLSSPCTSGKVEEEESLESSSISGIFFSGLPRYPLTHLTWDWPPCSQRLAFVSERRKRRALRQGWPCVWIQAIPCAHSRLSLSPLLRAVFPA